MPIVSMAVVIGSRLKASTSAGAFSSLIEIVRVDRVTTSLPTPAVYTGTPRDTISSASRSGSMMSDVLLHPSLMTSTALTSRSAAAKGRKAATMASPIAVAGCEEGGIWKHACESGLTPVSFSRFLWEVNSPCGSHLGPNV